MLKKLLAIIAFLFYAATAFANVDANTASATDLQTLKGIGPAISERIIDARQQGPFKDWNDLITRVKGIGNKNAVKFSAEGLTVGGASLQGAPATVAATKTTKKAAAPAAALAATAPAATPAAQPAAADTATPKKKGRKSKKAEAAASAAATAPAATPAAAPLADTATPKKKSRKSKKAAAAASAAQ